jgi:hypothetical protein
MCGSGVTGDGNFICFYLLVEEFCRGIYINGREREGKKGCIGEMARTG